MARRNNDCKYTLFSVIIHQGTAHSGHYFAYIFDDSKKAWFKCNDMRITEVDQATVMKDAYGGDERSKCSAYMLFYRRASQKPAPCEVPKALSMVCNKENKKFSSRVKNWQKFVDQQGKSLALLTRMYNHNMQIIHNKTLAYMQYELEAEKTPNPVALQVLPFPAFIFVLAR